MRKASTDQGCVPVMSTPAATRSAFTTPPDASQTKTLVSTTLAGIFLVPIEFEVGRQTAAKGARALQQVIAPGLARHTKLLAIGDMDFNLVALLEAKRFNHDGGEPDGKAAPHFSTGIASLPTKAPYLLTPRTACCTAS